MSTKRYKLLKDLPDGGKPDDIYERSDTERFYYNKNRWPNYVSRFEEDIVENNPEWFSLIEGEEKKEFQWTDELVRDFIGIAFAPCDPNHQFFDERIADFKSSHQSIKEEQGGTDKAVNEFWNEYFSQSEPRLRWSDRKKRDWEIMEMENKYGKRHVGILDVGNDWSAYLNNSMWEINKVKRLSDGLIFVVGEDTPDGRIESFEIHEGGVHIKTNLEGNKYLWFCTLEKNKPQPTKERTEVTFLSEFAAFVSDENWHYSFWSTKPIQPNQFESLKHAIEAHLNHPEAYHDWQFRYTQQQLDEKEEAAFYAARWRRVSPFPHNVYKDFQEYKKSKA